MNAEAVRLNLGGAGEGFRNGRIPGFKTVDLREGKDTDIVANVENLSFCENDSVQEIYASNILEHFPHIRTVDILKEWHRVLVPRGTLYVSVPDFNASVRVFEKVGLVPWVQYLIWGDQKHALNYHYINFTFATLAEAITNAGFSDVKRVNHFPFGNQDASEIIDNVEFKPISLNCEATK
jgi:predicted SAM-dependent methyltransferase